MIKLKNSLTYTVTIYPPLNVIIPDIGEQQFELINALTRFTDLTNDIIEYDVAYPIEYLAFDILTSTANVDASLRELELDFNYIYGEINSNLNEEIASTIHDADYMEDSNVLECITDISEILATIAYKFFEYVRKGHTLTPKDISRNVCEIVAHDDVDYFALQYLIHPITKKEDSQ